LFFLDEMTLVGKKIKIVIRAGQVRIWKEEMIIAYKFTVELEEYFLAQTYINGKRLRAYIENKNIYQNTVNQPSVIYKKHNGQNMVQHQIFSQFLNDSKLAVFFGMEHGQFAFSMLQYRPTAGSYRNGKPICIFSNRQLPRTPI